jgi:hypothetical protein
MMTVATMIAKERKREIATRGKVNHALVMIKKTVIAMVKIVATMTMGKEKNKEKEKKMMKVVLKTHEIVSIPQHEAQYYVRVIAVEVAWVVSTKYQFTDA